ncbi:putative ribonuclease H-like domain-containing protein [Tanacetum coccineum]
MNYQPVRSENQANKYAGPQEANHNAGTQDNIDAGDSEKEDESAKDYFVLPIWSSFSSTVKRSTAKDAAEALRKEFAQETENLLLQAGAAKTSSTNIVNTTSTLVSIDSPYDGLSFSDPSNPDQDDSEILALKDIYKNPTDDSQSAVQTRSKVTKCSGAHAFVSYIQKQRRNNHKDFQHYLFACFLSQNEPKKISEALEDESWVYAMQEELCKKDERGVVVRNKTRIEAIRIFLAFASYMGFIVYQMDVKSAFLYGKIDEEVYVSQPPGFIDPKYPPKVYKVVKALYGLHQAPRAWYATLSTFLLNSRYRRGTIDKTLFIKKDKHDIILVQVYVDDIIFGSTKKSLCDEFEALIKSRFQMSSMGELTFFLGLQDGIFISQDKYVAEILKKFDFVSVKPASTPIETHKPLVKDEEASDVDVHLYIVPDWHFNELDYFSLNNMLQSVLCFILGHSKTLSSNCWSREFFSTKGNPKLVLWDPRCPNMTWNPTNSDICCEQILTRKSTTEVVNFLGRETHFLACKKRPCATSTTEATNMCAAASCHNMVAYLEKSEGMQSFTRSLIFLSAVPFIMLSLTQLLQSKAGKSGLSSEASVRSDSSLMMLMDRLKTSGSTNPTPSPVPTNEIPIEPQTDSSLAHTSEVPIEPQTDLSPRPSPSTIITYFYSETSVGIFWSHSSVINPFSGNSKKLKKQANRNQHNKHRMQSNLLEAKIGKKKSSKKQWVQQRFVIQTGRKFHSQRRSFKQLKGEEMARKIQEEWEERIEADRLLTEKLQEQEREQFTIEERAKFLHDTIAAQRKFLAQQRSEAIRNRPPTKNQLRN